MSANAHFPSKVWDGSSRSRSTNDVEPVLEILRAPDGEDYAQLVAEIRAVQISLVQPQFDPTPEHANTVLAGPVSGPDAMMQPRALIMADLPEGLATLASPTFTGTVTLPSGTALVSPSISGSVTLPAGAAGTTPTTNDNSTILATTAFVKAQSYAPLASPTFTGTPAAPTPATTDNSTALATTAYVNALAKNATMFGSSYRAGVNTFNYLPTNQAALPTATITVGSVSGDIPSAQVIAAQSSGALDTRYFRLRGTTFSFPDSTFCEGAANVTQNNKTGWWAIEFCHYGQKFQINIKGAGGSTASSLRVWANGLPCNSIVPQVLRSSPGSSTALPLVDFGTTDFRRIRIEVSKEFFGGLRIGANDSIIPADWPIGMKAIAMTDSYGDGNAGDGTLGLNHYNSFAHVLGAALGLDMWCSPCGGTGYLQTSSTGGTFRSRVTNDVINQAPSVVFITGGYNDRSGFTQAQLTTEIGLLIDAIQAGLPNVPIIIVGPWCPTTTASTGDPSLTNSRAASLAVATSYNLPFIDTFFWVNSGNIAQMVQSFDNVHPTFQGHIYLGMKIAGWVNKLGLDLTGKASTNSPSFFGSVTLDDATNVALGSTTGTKIGTATTQKLGFWNQAPVVQPSGSVLTALGTSSGVGLISSPTIAESDVTNLVSDLALKAPLSSPAFTSTPTAPTAAAGTNTTQLATTAFVRSNINGSPGTFPRTFITGKYYFVQQCPTVGTNTPTNGEVRAFPVTFGAQYTVTKIGIETTTAASLAGSTIRLGIWNDNGSNYPGTLLIDAGTVDATTAISGNSGCQEVTLSQQLGPGTYWFGYCVQNQTSGTACITRSANVITGVDISIGSSTPTAGVVVGAYAMTYTNSTTGAGFPNFSASVVPAQTCSRMWFKV